MNLKQKVAYTGLGAAISIVSMLNGTLLTTCTPQIDESPTFDTITCNTSTIASPPGGTQVHQSERGLTFAIFGDDAGFTYIGPGSIGLSGDNASVNLVAEHGYARIGLDGGRDKNHRIKLFTKYSPSATNSERRERRFFGIAMSDYDKSNHSRAVMGVTAYDEGAFTC